jgi:hypothetical protein
MRDDVWAESREARSLQQSLAELENVCPAQRPRLMLDLSGDEPDAGRRQDQGRWAV